MHKLVHSLIPHSISVQGVCAHGVMYMQLPLAPAPVVYTGIQHVLIASAFDHHLSDTFNQIWLRIIKCTDHIKCDCSNEMFHINNTYRCRGWVVVSIYPMPGEN